MDDILKHWNLTDIVVTPIDSPSKSTWDINGYYILKRFSNAEELRHSLQFSELLDNEGIPVATYIPTNDSMKMCVNDLYCLMTKLPGKHVDFFQKPNLASEMGRALARLHIALAHIQPKISFANNDLITDWNNYIKQNLFGAVSDDLIERVESKLLILYPKLPRQLIHRDVHCFNVLFDGDKLTGWLDFDLGQKNVRLFDIAYMLAGLLLGEIHDIERIKTWRLIHHAFLLGYDEVNPLTNVEYAALPVLMIVIEYLFISFWNSKGNLEQCNGALELANWLCNEYEI